MTKRGHRRVVLNDFKAKKAEEGSIDIETDDGTFTIPPPELWDDEVMEHVQSGDTKAAAVGLLGSERFEAFCKAGGSATLIAAIVNDTLGASLGK